MFTGIVETIGTVVQRVNDGSNVRFCLRSSLSDSVGIDDSVSHNGVCLTVTKKEDGCHWVTAVDETLQCTNLGKWQTGSKVNLERAMLFNGRIDGHLVQGHVDTTAVCKRIKEAGGSWLFEFELDAPSRLLVNKGSVCVNGVSLTLVEPGDKIFSVAIIPFTFEHTTFHELRVGDKANIEFDIIGKYLERFAAPFLIKQP